jgi:hypothetical protein
VTTGGDVCRVLGTPTARRSTVKIIQIQPEAFLDDVRISADKQLVEMKKLPYPFAVREDGEVDGQDFWRGDPAAVLGFQNDEEVQQINVWWSDVVADPELAVGKFPVMREENGNIYTYTVAIESVQVFEVPA